MKKKTKIIIVIIIILMIFLVPLVSPLGRVGCGACCPDGTVLRVSIPPETIFYSQIGLNKDIMANSTNASIRLDYGFPQKNISGSAKFRILSDRFEFPGFSIEKFKLDKNAETLFEMELNISEHNHTIICPPIWNMGNIISFTVSWIGDVLKIEKTIGPANVTITEKGKGEFSMNAPWNLEVSINIRTLYICWDGVCPWWMPDKNHCPHD